MIAIILNPASGGVAETETIIRKIEETLPSARVFLGDGCGSAMRNVDRAVRDGFRVVVAAGGDGTLNEVLNAVMPYADHVRLGLLPLGTGNDFARTVNIPPNLGAALDIVRAGSARKLDVIRVSRASSACYFLNVAAGGFSGTVSEKLTGELKAAWGPLSYVRGMIEALPELSPYECLVKIDDDLPFLLNAFNIVIANARFVARGLPIAPAADPADGWLDVVAIRENPPARLALLTPIVLAGRHLDNDGVFYSRARRVTIEATPQMPFNTDGELIGESPWTFELLPSALTMITPAE